MRASTEKPRVGLLGLGLMGNGMAGSLLKAGFPLTVYNRTRAKAEAYEKAGATVASSAREVAEHSEFVVSMLADDRASQSVWQGDEGALAGLKPGSTLIECSTVSLEWVAVLAGEAKARNAALLDAPVTGSRVQAAAGELTFLVGGESPSLDAARPVLDAMGKAVVHLGPTGSGALMKLINNFMCGVQLAALAEAMNVIEHSELDREQAVSILTSGAPGSPLVKLLSARMLERDYEPHFLLRLLAKDLRYALAEGTKLNCELNMVEAALRLFESATERGFGEQDMSAVVEPFRSKP